MPQNYNRLDKASVLSFAKKIKDKSLREVCDESILEHNYSGKGNFGQILEKYYFQYEPNSDSEADFSEINLELKATPLKQLKNRHYRSKERLVLNIINYLEIVDQDFVNSTFWKKILTSY
nr:MutH/Sau3AI family endonuclease [Candidatus Brachybacter algidus]